MNRDQLLKERECYLNSEPQRIFEKAYLLVNEWTKSFIEHGVTIIDVTNEDENVVSSMKDILTTKGFNIKIKGGGVSFDGYPDDTIIHVTNI